MTGLVAMVLAAAPPFTIEPGLEPASEIREVVTDQWKALDATWSARLETPLTARIAVRVERERLLPGRAGVSQLGRIGLRRSTLPTLSVDERRALEHEVSHQFLLQRCPSASGDVLFHEAFALVTSGELDQWKDGDYQSLSSAAKVLQTATSYDTKAARRALARLLAESVPPKNGWPRVIERKVSQCNGKTQWVSLSVEELATVETVPGGLATVVMSRHSGEVLLRTGDIATPRPFGSILKPFVLAAAAAPRLPRRPDDLEWAACGVPVGTLVDGPTALLLSCNGYFLDWSATAPRLEQLGRWGEVLTTLGLERLPEHMTEAIGVRSTLSLSPLAIAAAYRLLGEARPDLLAVMRRNAAEGTMAHLPESSRLSKVALKTGTVRDGSSRVAAGWLVGVTDDVVVVMLSPGEAPKQFAKAFADVLDQTRRLIAVDAVSVQTFALVTPSAVDLRCERGGFAARDGVPVPLSSEWGSLAEAIAGGSALCLTAPFSVRIAKTTEGRGYAGVFRREPPSPYIPPIGMRVTESERRARTGSEVLFRTTRLLYVSGVLASEASGIGGEGRAALARVISHNADTKERHGTRPLCDTTHCQVFQGTRTPRADDSLSLERSLPYLGWLPFYRGGTERWTAKRPRRDIAQALGFDVSSVVRFERLGARVRVLRTKTDDGASFEEWEEMPCERVRAALRLVGCPSSMSPHGEEVDFEGQGAGHGMGLDVEAARSSGLDQDTLLRRSYATSTALEGPGR
jgi:hypothetical protein